MITSYSIMKHSFLPDSSSLIFTTPQFGKSSNILSSTTMAMNVSPPTPVCSINQQKPYVSPRSLLSLQPQDSHISWWKSSSWGAASSYVRLEVRVVRSFAARAPLKERRVVFRCATIEEIEDEKALIEEAAKERMDKTIDNLRANFNSIRTGRSNPAMLDKIEKTYKKRSSSTTDEINPSLDVTVEVIVSS